MVVSCYDKDDDNALIGCLVVFLLELPFNLSMLVFKLSYIVLFGVMFFLADCLKNFYVWFKRSNEGIDPKDMLHFAFLNSTEMAEWLRHVDSYASILKKGLENSNFLLYMLDVKFAAKTKRGCRVSFLHTGSIPEQVGKPIMVFEGLLSVVCNSFPELRSDHDVMLVLEDFPVNQGKEYVEKRNSIWLKAEKAKRGSEEFVKVVPMQGAKKLENYLSTKLAMNFFKASINDAFFYSNSQLLKNLPAMLNTREIVKDKVWESNKVLVEQAGPSINVKITGDGGHLVFDCDFLLSLPVVGWPSPAEEWVQRQRKWPNEEFVRWLAQLPCHLIAKPILIEDDQTWRFSFSRQELEITRSMTENSRLCYIALKFIFKKYVKQHNSGLKSYHMLTLFLWFLESKETDFWMENSLKEIIEELVKYVSSRIRSDEIPHYFIRTINLADLIVGSQSLHHSADKLNEIVAQKDWFTEVIFDQNAYDTIVLYHADHVFPKGELS